MCPVYWWTNFADRGLGSGHEPYSKQHCVIALWHYYGMQLPVQMSLLRDTQLSCQLDANTLLQCRPMAQYKDLHDC